jgi:hypothetical protein
MTSDAFQVWIKLTQSLQIRGREGRINPRGVPWFHLAMINAKSTSQDIANCATGGFVYVDKYKHRFLLEISCHRAAVILFI